VKNSLNEHVQTTEQYYKAQLDIQLSKQMNRYIKAYIIINIYKYIFIVII